jgi:hypothetical protein
MKNKRLTENQLESTQTWLCDVTMICAVSAQSESNERLRIAATEQLSKRLPEMQNLASESVRYSGLQLDLGNRK